MDTGVLEFHNEKLASVNWEITPISQKLVRIISTLPEFGAISVRLLLIIEFT